MKAFLKKLFAKDLSTEKARKIPKWALPLLLFIFIGSFVIVLAPRVFKTQPDLKDFTGPEGQSIYHENQAMIQVPQAGLYPEADAKKERLASALYNEPVEILNKGNGIYWKVRLTDGSEGYVKAVELTEDLDPIEPNKAYFKAMVLGRSKRVFSHARKGELLKEVPMGSILYCDYKGANLLRVKLPDGKRGWVTNEQLWIVAADEDFAVPDEEKRSRFLSSLMAFYGAQRLPAQMTVEGADMAGAISVAARLNGLDLPRELMLQAQVGEKIELSTDPETKLPRLDNLKPGDLIYFVAPNEPSRIVDAACVMEGNIVLMNQVNSPVLSLWDLEADEERRRQIGFVRRHFQFPKEETVVASTTVD